MHTFFSNLTDWKHNNYNLFIYDMSYTQKNTDPDLATLIINEIIFCYIIKYKLFNVHTESRL